MPLVTPGNINLIMNSKTVQTAVGWNWPATTFFFSFEVTENRHIDKAIDSQNKNTRSPSGPTGAYGTSDSIPQVHFLF